MAQLLGKLGSRNFLFLSFHHFFLHLSLPISFFLFVDIFHLSRFFSFSLLRASRRLYNGSYQLFLGRLSFVFASLLHPKFADFSIQVMQDYPINQELAYSLKLILSIFFHSNSIRTYVSKDSYATLPLNLRRKIVFLKFHLMIKIMRQLFIGYNYFSHIALNTIQW